MILPKAKDGNLDYGLIRSCMALDEFKANGDEYKNQHGTTESSDDGVVQF